MSKILVICIYRCTTALVRFKSFMFFKKNKESASPPLPEYTSKDGKRRFPEIQRCKNKMYIHTRAEHAAIR